MKFTLKGPPTPLARARHGKMKVYDPQRNKKLVDGLEIARQYTGPLLAIPLLLTVDFHFLAPRSYSNLKRSRLLHQPHKSKPDLSNLVKYLEDICTGILYTDDALIAKIVARKIYSQDEYTEFTLEPFVGEYEKKEDHKNP